jgi:hypothetical protein
MNNHSLGWWLMVDFLAIIAFVIIGKSSHSQALEIGEIFATAWPFIVGLAIAGWWLRNPLPSATIGVLGLLKTTLASWLLAVPFGLMLRELIYDKPILPAFAITTFIFGVILLISGRLLLWFFIRRGVTHNANKRAK